MHFLKRFSSKHILILLLLSTAFLRLYRLDYPDKYVFDEVYHAFTAKEFLAGHKEAWEWWTKPPPGVAYEWTHPPLAKEAMALSMFIFHTEEAWAYRLPGALLGVLSVYLIFLLGLRLLKNQNASLIAAFVFSLDGLNFVQSRTGMNDIYYVTFVLISILFILNRKFFWSAVFFGLAISSKWAAIYLLFMYFILLLYNIAKHKGNFLHISGGLSVVVRTVFYFIIIPPAIYLLSYLPFFILDHSFNQFIQLQQQMWWYHTNLKATHTYSSPWWSWPLNLYPIWYFVDYQKNTMANIFASGNPVVFWTGSVAVIASIINILRGHLRRPRSYLNNIYGLFIICLGFLSFWLPWAISPRIMFLYHFSPSVPFLSLALGYQLNTLMKDVQGRKIALILLALMILSFILLYPYLTGIPLNRQFINLFFLTNLSKNPF